MAYYALSMLREFSRMIPENVVLFHGAHGRDLVSSVKEIRNIRRMELRHPGQLYDERSSFDVLFTPTVWGGVNMLDYPTVHVIPDIQEKYYPEFFSEEERELRDTISGHAARASTILITISQYSKRTIVEKFGVPENQVSVTPLAAHPIFSDSSQAGTKPTGLPDRFEHFLLYPANNWGHKNHKKLLDGLVDLRSRYGLEIPCVFTGHLLKGHAHHIDLPREISARGMEKQVCHLGTVSLGELKYLYLHATALVHPSLFEGFGIPLLEAMSCGCPIVAANATSLPEIGGDAALYFNPQDPSDIADKIHHLVEQPDEVGQRVAVGLARSQDFNDTKTAKETLQVLEQAYGIAGIDSLKARAADRRGQGIFLTVLIVVQERPEQEPMEDFQRLLQEFPHCIRIVAVAPEKFRERLSASFPANLHVAPLQGSLRETLSKVVEDLNAEYVFLSDGKSVPIPSFLYYLMADAESLHARGELIEGDWYGKVVGKKGLIDSPILPAGEREKRRAYACENLCFAVEKQAFQKVVKGPRTGADTPAGIAADLWDSCSRVRIYRTVVERFGREPSKETYNLSLVTRKIKEASATKKWLRPLLESRAGSRLLAMLVQTYYRLPSSLQRAVLKAYKTLAANGD